MRDVDESTLLAWLVAELSVMVEVNAGLCNSIDERTHVAQIDIGSMREIGVSDRGNRSAIADRDEWMDDVHVTSEEEHRLLMIFMPEPRP